MKHQVKIEKRKTGYVASCEDPDCPWSGAARPTTTALRGLRADARLHERRANR